MSTSPSKMDLQSATAKQEVTFKESVASIHLYKSSSSSATSLDPCVFVSALAKMLRRMESKPLLQQRYTPTDEKLETVNSLALVAKIEKMLDLGKIEHALDRRMSQQDFVISRSAESRQRDASDLN
ncbi:uncharacterized protein V2V93DRAFT_116168 [Kockiozyma suomiensis]|uniref:uncharacterized protein n=1 Tax=Kockiozyma suomiensis TaxID=1337062 RepID=UPI0033442490